MLTTKIHGVADYVLAALLITLPWLWGFNNAGASTWIVILVGVSIITYSALTNYELGVVKLIPMPSHLILDVISGIVLMITPFLFGFEDSAMWPHIFIGAVIILITIRSSKYPS